MLVPIVQVPQIMSSATFFFCHQGKFTRTVPRTTEKMHDARIMRKILSFLLTKSLWSESLAKESLCSQLQEGGGVRFSFKSPRNTK